MVKLIFDIKCKGAGILEVIVSFTILTFIFSLVVYFFVLLDQESFQKNSVIKEGTLDQYVYNSVKEKAFFDESKKFDIFSLERSVENYKSSESLFLITFKIFDKDYTLLAKRQLIVLNE